MARWQIRGLLLLGAALAGLTLAASASPAAERPAQVAADRLPCAMNAGRSDGAYPSGSCWEATWVMPHADA